MHALPFRKVRPSAAPSRERNTIPWLDGKRGVTYSTPPSQRQRRQALVLRRVDGGANVYGLMSMSRMRRRGSRDPSRMNNRGRRPSPQRTLGMVGLGAIGASCRYGDQCAMKYGFDPGYTVDAAWRLPSSLLLAHASNTVKASTSSRCTCRWLRRAPPDRFGGFGNEAAAVRSTSRAMHCRRRAILARLRPGPPQVLPVRFFRPRSLSRAGFVARRSPRHRGSARTAP